MKKLLSILAVFVFIISGGILLSACGEKNNNGYTLNIPANLSNYGIDKIYTNLGDNPLEVSEFNNVIYFEFLPHYFYDQNTMKIDFQSENGSEAVGELTFCDYDDTLFINRYKADINTLGNITVSVAGESSLVKHTVSFTPNYQDLSVANKDRLMINFEINGKSTGDLTFNEFDAMINDQTTSNGGNLLLKNEQQVDYGTIISATIWNKEFVTPFPQALQLPYNPVEEFLPSWEYCFANVENKLNIKTHVEFKVGEDMNIAVFFNEADFEDTFGMAAAMLQANPYCGDSSFFVYDTAGNEINTITALLKESCVTLKMSVGEENLDGTPSYDYKRYIYDRIKEDGLYNNFSVVLINKTTVLSNIQAKTELNADFWNRPSLVFENIPIHFEEGLIISANDAMAHGLIDVIWEDFQQAMDADFDKLPRDVNVNVNGSDFFLKVEPYCSEINLNDIMSVPLSSTEVYVPKNSNVEYYIAFTEEVATLLEEGFSINLTVEGESQILTLRNETQSLTYGNGKFTVSFEPAKEIYHYMYDGILLPYLSIKGNSADFTMQITCDYA